MSFDQTQKADLPDCGESEVATKQLDRKKWGPIVRELSQLRPLPLIWAAVVQYGVIASCIALSLYTGHWLVYLLSIVVIGTRQHALGILMHEGSHYRVAHNKALNDAISNFFFAFPLLLSTTLYRRFHLPHHRYTNTDRDPQTVTMAGDDDWVWPKDNIQCFKTLFFDTIGINMGKVMKVIGLWNPLTRLFAYDENKKAVLPKSERIQFTVFLLLVCTMLYVTQGWLTFLILWVIPASTVLGFLFRFRGVAEHLCLLPAPHTELTNTRTVIPTPIEKFLVCQCGINWHIEHHIFPSVPFYNLKKLHQLLMEDPVFAEQAFVTRGYFNTKHGLLSQIVRPRTTHQTAFGQDNI